MGKSLSGTSRWIPKEEFDSIYARVPRITVELIVHTDAGVVLSKRSIEPCIGQWHIPGGTVYFGETLEEAVRRVANDELGVEVKVGEQIGYIEYPLMASKGYKGWPVGIVFETTIIKGELRGSAQGEEVGCFKEVPDNTIHEQAEFLCKIL